MLYSLTYSFSTHYLWILGQGHKLDTIAALKGASNRGDKKSNVKQLCDFAL